jgi:type II secretory pathway component GspD/PulD (secretin)
MLENGDLLSVARISSIDVGMVPRIPAEQVELFSTTRPHAFIKVSFQLDWMLAEQAVEELKPMMSPNGKLHSLKNTNRLEAMDAAINLRDVSSILQQEQSDHGQERLVKEFPLVHARASEVVTQLEALLGLESDKSSAPMTPQQMQQMQRMQQQMQQAQRKGKPAPAKREEAKVHLIVNQRKNSILTNAPPDKMAIIEQAVKALDVKSSRSDSILAKPYQVEVYRLHTIDPAAFAKTLEDLGDLDPVTRLEVDERNSSLIVYGSLVDHATIRQLVQRLDGSTRNFEVVQLRRLPADYVAGTIQFMMVGQDKDEGPGFDS